MRESLRVFQSSLSLPTKPCLASLPELFLAGWKFAAALAVITVVVVFASARPARSAVITTTVENFDGSIGDATWRLDDYFSSNDRIESSGGHPGAFLHNPSDVSSGPIAYYVGPSGTAFLGDYRATDVTSLGIDVNIFSGEIDRAGGYPWKLWLNLYSGTDTENNEYDDCRVGTVGAALPVPGSVWKSFTFKVPVDRASLPPGWLMEGVCNNLSQDEAWNFLITHVSDVSFSFEGGQYAIFQTWDVGIDSVRITSRTNGPAADPVVPVWTLEP